MKKKRKTRFIIKILPFIPLIITLIIAIIYFALLSGNENIQYSPYPLSPELPQLNPPETIFTFSIIILIMFIVLYYFSNKDY